MPYTAAQEVKYLSDRPFITQEYVPANNETEVKVFLSSKAFFSEPFKVLSGKHQSEPIWIYGTFAADAQPPFQSGIVLGYASYIYEGRTPTGKQSVRFAFYSKRKDTFKDPPAFSISVAGQAIQQGAAEALVPLTDSQFKQKVIVSVPTDVFLRVARARKVQFELGQKTYKPEGFQQKSMRALADIIDRQGK